MSATRRSGRRAGDTEERAAREAVTEGVEAVFQLADAKRKRAEESVVDVGPGRNCLEIVLQSYQTAVAQVKFHPVMFRAISAGPSEGRRSRRARNYIQTRNSRRRK